MPSRVPLTNLRDQFKGGAPLYVGGDRLPGEATSTPPSFLDDTDAYFNSRTDRRGLLTIAHIPPAGARTVDFVTLFLRNNSTTERAFVNLLLGPSLSVEMRVSGLQASLPIYSDVILADTDGGALAEATLDADSNAISIAISRNAQFDTTPAVEFEPPVSGSMSALVNLGGDGKIASVDVINPSSHSFEAAPTVRLRGGCHRELGFFEYQDEDTKVYGSSTAGALTALGTTCHTEFANNLAPGDAVLVNGEVRVVRATPRTDTFELDRILTGTETTFDFWCYLPLLSASPESMYRVGAGRLRATGSHALSSSLPHGLAPGDSVVYTDQSGEFASHRVATVGSGTQFELDEPSGLAVGDTRDWKFVYLYSEAIPGSRNLQEVNVFSYVKTTAGDGDAAVVQTRGLGGRQLFIRNTNFTNEPGSYHNASLPARAAAVEFCRVAAAHDAVDETGHSIDASTVVEVELKPQPAQEVQVLSGFPLNGGRATERGRRPLVALHQRGVSGQSTQVVFWGYYMRYNPESGTNYTQAINV